MTWSLPQSEEAWLECLSAYHDGELEPDERNALEKYLQTDPLRKEQLLGLKNTSHMLQEWEVSTPEPSSDFVRQIRRTLDEQHPSPLRRFFEQIFGLPKYRWGFQAAVFLFGLLIGALGMSFLRGDASSQIQPIFSQSSGKDQPNVVNIFIAPTQAENLLKEVAAGNLKSEILEKVKSRQWNDALSIYRTLLQDYPDTLAVEEIEQDKQLRSLKDGYRMTGRI
ncbi:MAG: hypothetical protein ABIH23_34425 [bacterium]